MTRDIEIVLYRESDQWVAQALNVDVSSFGDTADEARAALHEALELYSDCVSRQYSSREVISALVRGICPD